MILPQVDAKKCKGFPHYYVTEDGRVWSTKTGRFLNASAVAEDIPQLRVRLNGKTKYVQYPVAEAWLDNPEKHARVRLLDGDPTNLHKDNLAWASTKTIKAPVRQARL